MWRAARGRYVWRPAASMSSAGRPSIALQYYGHFNIDSPERHSDFFYWQQSSLPARNVTAKLTFDGPELNPDLSSAEEQLFLLQFPETYRLYALDERVAPEFDSPLR